MNPLPLVPIALAWLRGTAVAGYPPRMISLEPTNHCNYRCQYCPHGLPGDRVSPKGFMRLDDLDKLLDRIVAAGAAPQRIVSLDHGGEPLLHPEFPEMIRRVNARGLRPRFSSNGSRLTPAMADRLAAAGRFTVSVDWSSSREVFERCRAKPGHWERLREHLSYLIELSNRNPQVLVEIFEMGGFAFPGQEQSLRKQMRQLLPRPTSKRVEFGVRFFHNSCGLTSLSVGGQPLSTVSPQRTRRRRCPYPWLAMTIAWNGAVHTCPRDLCGQTVLGNALEAESLHVVWNGEEFQRFRRCHATGQLDELPGCRQCDLPLADNRAKWRIGNILRSLRKR